MVIDGHNGFVVPANDADALADAIKLAYDKHSDLQQMGLHGRNRVENYLTWDHFRHRLLHAYAHAQKIKNH
jgi:glycosyltransferase involved in cell wall biosynthesis